MLGEFLWRGQKKGSKIEALADGHVEAVHSGEGNSGGSRSENNRFPKSGNDDLASPLSSHKMFGPKYKRKYKQKTLTNGETSTKQDAHPHDHVSTDLKRIGINSATKILSFNIHGTIVDCSFLSKLNPNSIIRNTKKLLTRRIVFRPWLTKFLNVCFIKTLELHFGVSKV